MTSGLAVPKISSAGQFVQTDNLLGKNFPNIIDSKKFEKTMSYTGKFLVAPTAILSGVFGVLSFVKASILNNQSELIDKLATLSSKAALFSAAVFGGLQTAKKKDFFGTLGYMSDFMVSIFAKGEKFYLWKGWGSALDHSPAFLQDVANNPNIRQEYDASGKAFAPFNGFWDSALKVLYSSGVVLKDVAKDLFDPKKGDAFQRTYRTFIGKTKQEKNRTAERNLLLSSLGMMSGSFLGTILPFEKIGATIRDLFGIYADLAICDKADSEKQDGKQSGDGNKYYGTAGIFYTLGSVLDLIFRWTRLDNMHLLALGLDRIGNWNYVIGVQKDVWGTR
ncbi:MAG: hypothetical protein HYR97_09015 [Candidatus Melainabacteria bacterium]|nr:hypothetical protein [Candidatus Melainabacteria bacterium]